MNIAARFIKRPVLAAVINIVISVLGFVCLKQVSIREYPDIERKTISVSMEYAGASVDVVESQIAYKFEEALASLQGLKNMRSTITQGMCQIQLEFDSSQSINDAANNVASSLRRLSSDLPENLREPTIEKTDPSILPSFYLALSGSEAGSSELGDIMSRYVKSEIEAIPGIATVRIPGQAGTSLTYAIDVFMRPRDMASLKITPDEVFRGLSTQNFIQPAGDIFDGNRSYRMTVRAALSSLDEFKQIVVREKNGKIVRIGDIADVKLNDEDRNQRNRYNGKVVSFCHITTQPSANIINIAKDIKTKLTEINKSLPSKDLKLEIALDKSVYIQSSIKRLYKAIVEAIILVAVITFIFLKSVRATIIPLVSIPICLLSGFFIMFICGFTINVMTLLALLLGVGLVVDDSVVVIEKIISNIESGMKPFEASVQGMAEIQSSVIGMTLTLVAVYLPISLSNSAWGKFFNEFAVTLAGIVLVSGLVGIVLAPALSALILKTSDTHASIGFLDAFDKWFNNIKEQYRKILQWSFGNINLIISSALLLTLISLVVGKYFLVQIAEPQQDKNAVFLRLSTNHANLKFMTPILDRIEEMRRHPAVKSVISDYQSGSDRANITFILKEDPTKRISCEQFIEEMKKKYGQDLMDFMPRYDTFTSPLAESNMFGVTIKSNKNYDEIEDMGQELVKVLSNLKSPYRTKQVQFSRTRPEKTFNIIPNRERTYLLGAKLDEVRNAIKLIMRGNPPADRYSKNGKQYPIRLWVTEDNRRNPQIVKDFFVKSSKRNEVKDDWELISLKELVDVEESKVRPLIIHEGSQRAFDLYAEFESKNVNVVDAYKEFEKTALKSMPTGFTLVPNRDIRKLLEEGNNIIIMIALALVFVYLIMAAQFESFKDPLIVMCTVPLAVSWSLISLKLFPDGSLNAYSYVAILSIIGLITKNGILLVEFFNQKFAELKSVQKAMEEAAIARFRPIIMTTLAMVLGAVPLIVSKGSGHEGPRQVGIVLVGGLTFGTIMTLLVIPCICVLVNAKSPKKIGKKAVQPQTEV